MYIFLLRNEKHLYLIYLISLKGAAGKWEINVDCNETRAAVHMT